MKKGISLIELFVLLVIICIIGLIATIVVVGVIKDLRKDSDYLLIDNYANSIIYKVESYKIDNNILPVYCSIMDTKVFYDENRNDIFDNNELECDVNCVSDDCIKNFITSDDIKNSEVVCNDIEINKDNSIIVSDCYVNNKYVKNYTYKNIIKVVDE